MGEISYQFNRELVKEITASNLIPVLSEASNPIFLFFHLHLCSQCEEYLPYYQALATKFKEGGMSQYEFYEMNCTSQWDVCRRFSLNGVPHLSLVVGQNIYPYDFGLKGQQNFDHIIMFTQNETYKNSSANPEFKLLQKKCNIYTKIFDSSIIYIPKFLGEIKKLMLDGEIVVSASIPSKSNLMGNGGTTPAQEEEGQ